MLHEHSADREPPYSIQARQVSQFRHTYFVRVNSGRSSSSGTTVTWMFSFENYSIALKKLSRLPSARLRNSFHAGRLKGTDSTRRSPRWARSSNGTRKGSSNAHHEGLRKSGSHSRRA